MKREIAGIMVLVCLTIPILLASMPAGATYYRETDPLASDWTNPPTGVVAEWMTDQAMTTNKGGRPMFAIFWQNTMSTTHTVTLRARLVGYNSSWTTGWGVDCVASLNPADSFQLTTGVDGEGSYGTYTDYYQTTAAADQDNSKTGQPWGIYLRVPTNASETSVTIQCNITNSVSTTRYENATLTIGTNRTYTITLAANAMNETIKPDDTLQHSFSIVNGGTKTVDVSLDYALTVTDPDGDAVSTSGWSVKFYDVYGQSIHIQRNIVGLGTASPSFVLTTPSADDCPADSTVALTLKGWVCNDTRYDSSKALGGDDTKTSSDFTADDDDDDDDVLSYYGYAWYWWALGILGLGALAVYGIGIYKPNTGRRKKR